MAGGQAAGRISTRASQGLGAARGDGPGAMQFSLPEMPLSAGNNPQAETGQEVSAYPSADPGFSQSQERDKGGPGYYLGSGGRVGKATGNEPDLGRAIAGPFATASQALQEGRNRGLNPWMTIMGTWSGF